MISHDARVAVVIGHPGHELRIHRFLEIYRPIVFVLTDGSGTTGKSRLDKTLNIIHNTGSSIGSITGRFTDKEIYNLILRKEIHLFRSLVEELASAFEHNKIEVVVGDSNEGFSPTHDLCRYIINAATKKYAAISGKDIPNYEFYLEAAPSQFPPEKGNQLVCIRLNDEEFERKYEAAKEYPELAFELNRFLKKYGRESFKTEYLWPVDTGFKPAGWKGELPDYEIAGKKRVHDGFYDVTITYNEHLLPIAQQLYNENTLHQ